MENTEEKEHQLPFYRLDRLQLPQEEGMMARTQSQTRLADGSGGTGVT